MPRTMNIDSTDIYRAVVDELYVSDRYEGGQYRSTTVYGPHSESNQARDQGSRYWLNPTRVRKQKLDIAMDGETLVWASIKTTYTNGGEDVNWGEDIRGA